MEDVDVKAKQFILAYVALCKKHQLCVAPEAWMGAVCLAEYEEEWVKDIAQSEGVEWSEACQTQQ